MKTVPVMLRLDPADWKRFQQTAKDRDLMPAQLLRQVMRAWLLRDASGHAPQAVKKK